MYSKLIKNDIKKSKLITITITGFILIAALLTSLASILSVNLYSSIDNMMSRAKTPHFMQMHSGNINMDRMNKFVNNQKNIEEFQILSYLNIENAYIFIGENSLSDSVQDNGFSTQSENFDYLLDTNNWIVTPGDGEIFVPIYYMKEGKAEIGDRVNVHGVEFTVKGFLRDSQMNAAMVSSKRFLISKNDFEKIEPFGKIENLIEFRLKDTADVSNFESAYIDADLESNGPPAITHTMFRLVNAISDGMMIAVLALISILVIVINFLCIRFTLMAKIEEDYREIGVLKAIGLRIRSIKNLYLAKYSAMAIIGCTLGFLISLIVKEPLMANIRLYMGDSGNSNLGILLGLIGSALIFAIVIFYVNMTLNRFKKISPAETIRTGLPLQDAISAKNMTLRKNKLFSVNMFLGVKDLITRKKLYFTMLLVLIISAFLMIVPHNIHNTISQRDFMTYMGIGESDMRIDIQHGEQTVEKLSEISEKLSSDKDIREYSILNSYMYDARLKDGSTTKLKVELGDHSIFPIEYSEGASPKTESEIAISKLVSEDIESKVGDNIYLKINNQQKELTISGIYSDLTNGGKTAKATFTPDDSPMLWTVIPIKLDKLSAKENESIVDIEEKIAEYKTAFPYAKISNIEEYLDQIFGTTVNAIKSASYASIITAIFLTVLVTLLFMKMLVTKDRYSIAVTKSFGFTNRDIKKQYLTRSLFLVFIGTALGIILSNTIGEYVGVGLISSFGASTFNFKINPIFSYIFAPASLVICVLLATIFGISEMYKLNLSKYLKE